MIDDATGDDPVASDAATAEDVAPIDAPRPDAYVAPGGIRDLCVSRYHACVAHGADGIVQCWGLGGSGELGGGAPLLAGPNVVPCRPFDPMLPDNSALAPW